MVGFYVSYCEKLPETEKHAIINGMENI